MDSVQLIIEVFRASSSFFANAEADINSAIGSALCICWVEKKNTELESRMKYDALVTNLVSNPSSCASNKAHFPRFG